jgi:hypothetical protein
MGVGALASLLAAVDACRVGSATQVVRSLVILIYRVLVVMMYLS